VCTEHCCRYIANISVSVRNKDSFGVYSSKEDREQIINITDEYKVEYVRDMLSNL
jgi:hypothetical protein